MPVWMSWNYWATPLAYGLYCFILTQFGDLQDKMESGETVEEFVRNHFGFKHDMLAFVASMLLVFILLVTFLFAFAIKTINFQKR